MTSGKYGRRHVVGVGLKGEPESDRLQLGIRFVHAQAIRARGDWIPGVIDPAARGRSQHDGQQLLTLYQQLGLEPLLVADNSLEAGIYLVWERRSSGRLKVFDYLQNWLAEFQLQLFVVL